MSELKQMDHSSLQNLYNKTKQEFESIKKTEPGFKYG